MRHLFLVLIAISHSLLSIGQQDTYEIKPDALIYRILNENSSNKTFSFWMPGNQKLLPINGKGISKANQTILFEDNIIYVIIDGTGIVYKGSLKQGINGINFQRQDSTTFTGNNFNSLSFIYKGQLYNLGGYGFWRSNGQLKIFSQKTHDWNIEAVNKEIPVTKDSEKPNLWFDPIEEKVFSFGRSGLNQATIEKEDNANKILDSVYELNLRTKRWEKLGAMDESFKKSMQNYIPIVSTNLGLLVCNISKINFEIWNVNNNTISIVSKEKQKSFPISRLDDFAFGYRAPFVYFLNKHSGKLDSIEIGQNDLYKTDQNMYLKKHNSIHQFPNMLLIGAIILIVFIIYRLYHRSTIGKNKQLNNTKLKASKESSELFSEIEKSLIALLINNIKNGRMTSIDEVNYVLGISSKTVNMQKRTRSDVINSINSKFQIYFKIKVPLILRKNSEFDQRVKEFYIEDTHLSRVKNI